MQNNISSWLRNNISLVALLVVTFCIYIPSLSGDFVIDDVIFIKDNLYIRDIGYITRFFTKGLWENSSLEVNTEAMYRPMNLVPMMLNHALWGNNPFGYHLFLLLLHLANTCLVYVLVRKLANSSVIAATLGAAVFSLHPTRVESVAWICGGIDPLVTFFLLGALLAHLRFVASFEEIKKWRYLVLSLLCFQLALWSKEVAIIFPIVVVACDWIYKRKFYWLEATLQAAIVIVYLISRSLVLGSTGKWADLDLTHFSKVLDFGLGYSEMLLFPAHVPLYTQPPEQPVSSMLGILSLGLIFLLLGFCLKVANTQGRRAVAFSAVWMVGLFWPAVLLAFYINGFYAGRFLYVPALGFVIMAAILYDYLCLTYPSIKAILMLASIGLLGLYGVATWNDISAWHDDGTIHKKILQDSPENAVVFAVLGDFYMNKGNYIEAENNYLHAVEKAKKPQLRVSSLLSLGMIYGINNQLAQSEIYLQEVVKIDPKSSEGWTGLGNLAQMKGAYSDAISLYEKAIAISPKNYEATTNLAVVYDKTGQLQRGDFLRQLATTLPH